MVLLSEKKKYSSPVAEIEMFINREVILTESSQDPGGEEVTPDF